MADKKILQVGLILAFMDRAGLVLITRVCGPHNGNGKHQEITVVGKKREDEHSPIDAIWREAGEKICPEILPILRALYMKNELVELTTQEDDSTSISVWGAVLERAEDINLVMTRLATSGNYIRLICKQEVDAIVDLQTNYTPQDGATDGKIAMFPLPKEALVQAFKVLI